ncbi:MAG TPA: SpoIID/LytB domain-containing protein [Patescibacteria group bacterium]|jgi:SpoIID/LytB domain protein|nr:SpoIID/LytB domain-containing protein [Patescibacteria group bacterium]
MKKLLFLLFLILFVGLAIVLLPQVKAQDAICNNPSNLGYEDLGKCVDELTNAKQQSEKATAPLQAQVNAIKLRIVFIEQDLVVKKKNIDDGYANLAKQQDILNATIRDYYIKSYYNSPLLILLSANSASQLTQLLGYQKANADRDKAIITNIAVTINDLKNEKAALESEETSIAATKAKLDVIVAGALAYQATLSNQIAQLSALQQQILAQRLGALNIPLYAYNTQGGCSSDIGKDPGFSGGFGFFTYGVPNRVGLNQYGALGRSKAGQGYEDILKAYYNYDSIEKRDATINVDGNGSFSLDDYVKRIYEVPNEWGDQGGMNALRAQAIAARSYAMAYTNNGSGSICTTQQCQVFQPNPKGGNWEQAVNDTAGMVMVQGGNPIKAWFSSTHGGYIFSSGDIGWSSSSWTKNAQDTSSNVGSFSDLKSNAYDKDSPWFYCDWGSRASYDKTAWLKSDEVADIVNVILLLQNDSSVKDHLYQTDKSNPAGTDTWDSGRVKQELSKYRTPYNNVSDISVSADFGSGKATNVNVSGDAGSVSISASDFKNYFNLRAPANIQIVGPLYNVERN